MGKTILLAVGAFVILTVGGFFLWLKLNDQTLFPTDDQTSPAFDTSTGTSFDALIFSDTPIRCTFDNGGDKGAAYFSFRKARLDFDATLFNPDAESNNKYTNNKYHMIANNGVLYVWRNDEKNGILTLNRLLRTGVSTPSPVIIEGEDRTVKYGGFYSDADYNYLCDSWQEDPSIFDPPEDITFIKEPVFTTVREKPQSTLLPAP